MFICLFACLLPTAWRRDILLFMLFQSRRQYDCYAEVLDDAIENIENDELKERVVGIYRSKSKFVFSKLTEALEHLHRTILQLI